MVGDAIKRNQLSTIPPRKINVQNFAESRASELESLNSVVENRLNNDFRSRRNKRRRTTAYDNKAAKKRHGKRRKMEGVVDKSNVVAPKQDQGRALPRRIRRRIELRNNAASGFSTSGDGTKRLRTHVWHAKRFTMTKLWGFHLPLGLLGRGRGSRALLKWYKNGALLHDASYYTVVQLEGPQDSLIAILRKVMDLSSFVKPEENANASLSGDIFGSAMLHSVGAPGSQFIAPVTYMWRPCHHLNVEGGLGNEYNLNKCDEPQTSACCLSNRLLWVWIHASAFLEAYDALKIACQRQVDEDGTMIHCSSLEGQLAKLEAMGSKAFQLLKKILLPVSCNSKNLCPLKPHHVEEAEVGFKSSLLEDEEKIQSDSVLSFTVRDPRESPEIKIADIPIATSTTFALSRVSKEEPEKSATIPVTGSLENPPSSSELEKGCNFSTGGNLWDVNSRLNPPVEESVVCLEKHQKRMDFACLYDKKSGKLAASTEVHGSRSCPIILIKNKLGWSIILPLSWAKVFWIAFISNGAHAIGLREKRWVACETQLPHFPSDFPDCKAYMSFMENERASADQELERLPISARPLKVPIPPLWDSVRVTVENWRIAAQGGSVSNSENVVNANKSSDSGCGDANMTSLTINVFNATVARACDELISFLNEVNGDNVLLFPQVPNRKSFEQMKNEANLGNLCIGSHITNDRKMCFVRLVLHACKEGSFEEGAVVCAPFPSDVSQWTSRSEIDRNGLQIPQRLVNSYFKEKSSGEWEIQLPEDPAARESHRWPIGFVTNGFVRGSKKLVAVAFCEAILLAELRKKQWSEVAVKSRRKEIYVLVRNPRSSAYRLALASIVLEQHQDLDFL